MSSRVVVRPPSEHQPKRVSCIFQDVTDASGFIRVIGIMQAQRIPNSESYYFVLIWRVLFTEEREQNEYAEYTTGSYLSRHEGPEVQLYPFWEMYSYPRSVFSEEPSTSYWLCGANY